MPTSIQHPRLTREGVMFTIVVESVARDCVVTRDGLLALSHLPSLDENDDAPLALFHAYEEKISGVARRLVGARVPGNPLLMNRATFSAPHTD